MSKYHPIPDNRPNGPALALEAIATLAEMRLREFRPAMRRLEQAEAWAVGMTMQRLEHPDDPAWVVDTPWVVRLTSTAFRADGIPGIRLELELDKHGLRLYIGGPLPPDSMRLAVAAHFADEGRPFWCACGPGVTRALKIFQQQSQLFDSEFTAEVSSVPFKEVIPCLGARGGSTDDDAEMTIPATAPDPKLKARGWGPREEWEEGFAELLENLTPQNKPLPEL